MSNVTSGDEYSSVVDDSGGRRNGSRNTSRKRIDGFQRSDVSPFGSSRTDEDDSSQSHGSVSQKHRSSRSGGSRSFDSPHRRRESRPTGTSRRNNNNHQRSNGTSETSGQSIASENRSRQSEDSFWEESVVSNSSRSSRQNSSKNLTKDAADAHRQYLKEQRKVLREVGFDADDSSDGSSFVDESFLEEELTSTQYSFRGTDVDVDGLDESNEPQKAMESLKSSAKTENSKSLRGSKISRRIANNDEREPPKHRKGEDRKGGFDRQSREKETSNKRNNQKIVTVKSAHGSDQSQKMELEHVVRGQLCKSIAVLGTMSDAGKSVITTGLCRILANNGLLVAPFKGQNMSNNAAPALLPEEGRRKRLYKSFEESVGSNILQSNDKHDTSYGEIGTAQSLQAEAARLIPRVEMNPVLLKSGGENREGEHMCSIVVLGRQIATETYGTLSKRTTDLRMMVLESHQALAEATKCKVIIIEGAGSCTELNLMDRDIVNLPLVRALNCPWLLVADIDRGGVFAQIIGTKMCCSRRDWSLCVGIIVNKFRGDIKHFDSGKKMIEEMVGKQVFVVPFLTDLNLPEEDAMATERRLVWEKSGSFPVSDKGESTPKPIIVVVCYPHIAMSDDICAVENDPRFEVQWRRCHFPKPYPHTTSIILPGSRLTRKDLKWLHDSGWASFLRKHISLGGTVLGICGGYQMLGWTVEDPEAIEGRVGRNQGLGFLPIRTVISRPQIKVVLPIEGKLYRSKTKVRGFELHCGRSDIVIELGKSLGHQVRPLVVFDDGKLEGMRSGNISGTYIHGLLRSPEARVELLVPKREDFPILSSTEVHDSIDRLATHLESCGLDYPTLTSLIGMDDG